METFVRDETAYDYFNGIRTYHTSNDSPTPGVLESNGKEVTTDATYEWDNTSATTKQISGGYGDIYKYISGLKINISYNNKTIIYECPDIRVYFNLESVL